MSQRTSVRHELVALWGDGTGKVLLAIAGGWGLLNGTRMIFPVILPQLTVEYGLTLTTAGLLITVIWLAYSIGQVPGGALVDHYGERLLMATSLATVIVGVGLVVVSSSPLALYAAVALVGVGQSLYPIARITALAELYPERLGSALGVTMAGGDVGQTVLPPVAGVITVAFVWQFGLGFVLPLLLLAAVGVWATVPGHGERSSAVASVSIGSAVAVLRRLRSPAIVSMALILFLFITIWQTFSAFFPTYLIQEKGLSPAMASGLFGMFFAVGVVAKPAAGFAYDRIGPRGSLPLVMGGAVLGLLLLPSVEGLLPLAGVTVLVSTMLGSGAITQSYLAENIPDDIQGTGLGVVRSTSASLAAMGPVLFGVVADRGFFDEGYLLLGLLVGVITLLSLRVPVD